MRCVMGRGEGEEKATEWRHVAEARRDKTGGDLQRRTARKSKRNEAKRRLFFSFGKRTSETEQSGNRRVGISRETSFVYMYSDNQRKPSP